MKKGFYILLAGLALCACTTRELTIETGDLRLEMNSQMQLHLEGQGAKAIYDGYVSPDALVAAEVEASEFAIIEKEAIENGYRVVGVFTDGDFKVEKHQTLTTDAAYPGMVFIETFYVNKGVEITAEGYKMNRFHILPQDTVVWSFQPSSSSARLDWILPVTPGFAKENYLGMNNSDYGGGIPMIDLWRRDVGVATGILHPTLQTITMPVEWTRYTDYVQAGLAYKLTWAQPLAAGDTLSTFSSFIALHHGDFYNPLETFSLRMQETQGIKMQPSEPEAFEPVWCAWGYERLFTIKDVVGTLDKVAELGFRWVDVDDGFQIAEGDWETNKRFPGGDKDMRRLANEIHKRGMLAKLWWAPLAADPGTKVLKEHPELMLQTHEWIPRYVSWWDSYYLSPVNPHTTEYTNELLHRFIKVWDFDGLKIDGHHLNLCSPDYNPASGLDYPEQAQELMPTYFENVYNVTRGYKPEAVVQLCPCGCAMNFFMLPFFNQAVSSDPLSSAQVRMKRKAYAAMVPQMAYYGDHVELTDGGKDFASQIGVGAVIGSKFTYPKDNPHQSASFLLTPEREELIRHWMNIYKKYRLAEGKYLNLYDIRFDYPETHVISQNDAMYYAFYAPQFEGKIELRGLDADKTYTVTEYALADGKQYEVSGANPYITPSFEGSYLIEVKAKD